MLHKFCICVRFKDSVHNIARKMNISCTAETGKDTFLKAPE